MHQADQLASVHCATAEVRQSYKHKHLKTAFAHLPQSKEVTTAMGTKARSSLQQATCNTCGKWRHFGFMEKPCVPSRSAYGAAQLSSQGHRNLDV